MAAGLAPGGGSTHLYAMANPANRSGLDDYYRRIGAHRLAPLWERLRDLLPAEPVVRALPHLWDYEALRPSLLESATLIGAEEAERRVLILENPGLAGESAAIDPLFAGLQLLMPGETAPPHRHTPAAFRFILESDRAYTTVDGERIDMTPGDFILTPSWRWHGHGHDGDGPVVWLDVLDLPLLRAIGPRFAEHGGPAESPAATSAGRSRYRFGMNMAPIGTNGGETPLCYPFAAAREALERLETAGDRDPSHGVKLEYVDPTTGGPALPTVSAFLQRLPGGFSGTPYRSTESSIYCVVSGRGQVTVGDDPPLVMPFKPRDVFVIPCWHRHAFAVSEETVLFSASDRVVQQRLGIWRERRS